MELINQTYEILLESLKIQAEKYKELIGSQLDNSIRKDLDSEIKQMFELLSQMSNTSVILSVAEINTLKLQFETKLNEFTTLIESQDLTFIKGETGLQGIQGLKGDTGSQGLQGEKGETGLQGLQGLKGDTGLQGLQGLKGDTGSQGLQGEKGETGLQGLQGLKGDTGSQGLQGEKGLDGTMTFETLTPEQLSILKGEKGDTGLQGIQGLKGDKGDNGATGLTLTYDSLTLAQKQELANLVPVSGGGSAQLINKFGSFSSLYSKDASFTKCDFITSFKPNSTFTIDFSFYLDSLHNYYQIVKQNFFFGSSVLKMFYLLSSGNELVTAYITSEGYLAFNCSGLSIGDILLNLNIISSSSNDTLIDIHVINVVRHSSNNNYFPPFIYADYLASLNNGAT